MTYATNHSNIMLGLCTSALGRKTLVFLRVEHKERSYQKGRREAIAYFEKLEEGRKNKSLFCVSSTYGGTRSDKLECVKWIE